MALTGGFHLAFGVGAGLIVLAMALAATLLNRAQASQSLVEADAGPSADGVLDDCAA
ncbi:MAG: hypothetical protein JOZ65_12530 [Chloroflexi bacterium]|nr:hypothetical protein [Chloroflexota bacterium]